MVRLYEAFSAVGNRLLLAQQLEVGVTVHGAQRHVARPEQQPGHGRVDQRPVQLGHALVRQAEQVLAQRGDGAAGGEDDDALLRLRAGVIQHALQRAQAARAERRPA